MYYHYNEKAKNSRSDLLRGCMDIGQCARNQKSKCKIKNILKELEIQNEICWEVAWPADECGAKESAGFSFPRRAASTWMTQLKTQKWNLKTQNSKFSLPRRAASTWMALQLNWNLRTQNSEPKTQNSELECWEILQRMWCHSEHGVQLDLAQLEWRKFNFKLRLSGWMSTGFNLICTLIMMFENKNFTQMLSEIFVKR